MKYKNGIAILTGTSNPNLAASVAKILHKNVIEPVSTFPDGEKRVVIKGLLRRCGVFIIQPTHPPEINSNIMELLIMLDAAKRESPDEITAVIPYFGYARQDRREQLGAPVSAALVAKLIIEAGADRIITIDLHADQTIGSIGKPWDNLYASSALVPALKKSGAGKKTVVASPDKGGVNRAIKYAEMLGSTNLAMAYKQRDIDLRGKSKILATLGDVNNKDVVITDDIMAGGGTMINSASMMKENGAKKITVAVTHGLFLGDCLKMLSDSPIDKVLVTDSIAHRDEVLSHPKIEVVSVAPLLADAIFFTHYGKHLRKKYE